MFLISDLGFRALRKGAFKSHKRVLANYSASIRLGVTEKFENLDNRTMKINDKIINKLVCPKCHSALNLKKQNQVLSCHKCKIGFRIKYDIPHIILPETEKDLNQNMSEWDSKGAAPSFLSYKSVQFLKSPAPFKWFGRRKKLDWICRTFKDDGIYIDIGGTGNIHPSVVNINISASDTTHIVSDGQRLPFEDNSIDGIFTLLVLEHVQHPDRIAREIFRVLKPGGFVFATLPFIQVMHNNPKDYYRYTEDGIKTLFSDFQTQELQIAAGPSAAVIWILKEYLAILCPFSHYNVIYLSVREILGWLLYPLIIFDLYLNRKKRSAKMASFFSYYGLKK